MRFKEFLAEADHKRDISIEEAERLLDEHCKDAVKLFDKPLWRGTKGSDKEAYLVHAEADDTAGRKSANTSNYYTVIMDHFLPYFGYPKRSKSIILANNKNKDYTSAFGRRYAVFPYDGVPIGVCEDSDLWHTGRFSIGNSNLNDLTGWNSIFRHYKLLSASWPDFKQSLVELMESDPDSQITRWFGAPGKVDDVFRKAYSPETLGMELSNSANIERMMGPRELWIGGKCVAIREDVWEKMLEKRGST